MESCQAGNDNYDEELNSKNVKTITVTNENIKYLSFRFTFKQFGK